MIRLLVPLVLIYISQGSYAFDNSSELQSGASTRDLSSISDLFPPLEDLTCASQCEGHQGCGRFKDVDSCIDEGAEQGCFWVCR